MKTIVILFVYASCSVLSASAQGKESGVYFTQRDFENDVLSYASNSISETNKIHFNELLGRPYITIRHNGEKIRLFKDDIFAYKKKGRIVRTTHMESYTFAEKGTIWIYFKDVNVLLGKGIKRERRYYFSVSGKGAVIPLTITNLKTAFPGKDLFHNFLDAQFSRDTDLSLYDPFEKRFKVNQLLETTVFGSSKNVNNTAPASTLGYHPADSSR